MEAGDCRLNCPAPLRSAALQQDCLLSCRAAGRRARCQSRRCLPCPPTRQRGDAGCRRGGVLGSRLESPARRSRYIACAPDVAVSPDSRRASVNRRRRLPASSSRIDGGLELRAAARLLARPGEAAKRARRPPGCHRIPALAAFRPLWGDDLQRLDCAPVLSRVPRRVSASRDAVGADQRLVGALAAGRRVARALRADQAALSSVYSLRLSARARQRTSRQSARTGGDPAYGRMPRRSSPVVHILVGARRSLAARHRQRCGDARRRFEPGALETRWLGVLAQPRQPGNVGRTGKVGLFGRDRLSQQRGARPALRTDARAARRAQRVLDQVPPP